MGSIIVETWACSDCANANPESSYLCLRCNAPKPPASDQLIQVGQWAFSGSRWKTLLYSPMWVFSAVAESDGNVDSDEQRAFLGLIESSSRIEDFLLREVCGAVLRQADELWREYLQDTRSLTQALDEVNSILEAELPQQEALAFKLGLLDVGREVAKASGGGFIGKKDRISAKEASALANVASHLKVDMDNHNHNSG